MVAARKLMVAALAAILLSGTAFAHYHFLHYKSRNAPFAPVPEKFDLTALPNQTLFYFISDQGPEQMAPGDSRASILSQIRMAADVWSGVETSDLRLEFGGLFTPGALQANPGVDVLFDEVPPGLVALGGPTVRASMVDSEANSFVPIMRSVLILQKDLSQRPSYGDALFLTVVHEMGHALGLQHTMTSSVMATQITRAATKSRPLGADDVAGLSALYPAPAFAARTGAISGRVGLDGEGVPLASVVALAPNGTAVSTLTDPDGHYRLVGLTPGQYYLYVHPLPPAAQQGLGPADIVLPVDLDGQPFGAGPVFETVFYPGTKAIQAAAVLGVQAGVTLEGYDFTVTRRGGLDLFGVTTYSFPGNYAVKPAFVNVNSPRNFLVASGVGLTTNNAPSPGLTAAVMGGTALIPEGGVKAYAPAPVFVQLDFRFNPFSGEGPRHLLFSRNNDLYVLPAGLNLVNKQPPSITSVTPALDESGNRIAILAGNNLTRDTRILFDGLRAQIAGADETTGALTVVPPVGGSSHRAVVTALNGDGQTSMFLDAAAPPEYKYDAAEAAPYLSVLPSSLPAGSEAMVDIYGANTHFTSGQTVIGFGSSDIVVRSMWVLSPDRLRANVHVGPLAAEGMARLTVVTGFEIVEHRFALLVQPANPAAFVVNPRAVNPVTGLPSIYAGGQAAVQVSNLTAGAAVTVTLNDQPATVVSVEDGRLVFAVPAGLGTGTAILRISVGTVAAYPVVLMLDAAPPAVLSVSKSPAVPGEELVVTVTGLGDSDAVNSPRKVHIVVGGVDHTAVEVTPSESDPAVYLVRFTLSAAVPQGDQVPLIVRVGDRASLPVPIAVHSAEQPATDGQ
jgi:uncharacterized protein (TIGR03437 family)